MVSASEAFEELGGNQFDRWALPLTVPCRRCRVKVDERCVNPITGTEAKVACSCRFRDATKAEAS
jgi:hypothetical protein